MNLMFRKNFKEQKGFGGKSALSKSSSRHTNKRSNRESGYTPIEEHHYRTHLFFSPRCTYTLDESEEPRCGPMTGLSDQTTPLQSYNSGLTGTESDYHQPLVVRSPSVSLIKWPSPKNTPTRQVSFNYSEQNNNNEPSRNLSGLDRDCFIIPVHSLERFLPAGVPIPKPNANQRERNSIHVMEVPDPKLCVLCHLMSPLEPIDPMMESPLCQPLLKQRVAAGELISEIAQAKTAVTGMLLANMERNAEFPFISYYVINSAQTNPVLFYNNLRSASLSKFDPRHTKYTAAHTLDLYSEVASICRPPINESGTNFTRINTPSTGYVISVYKVFEGDDREVFERNWLYWTGARMIYRYLPPHAGLKKISLHKSVSPKVCALLLPALRARLTGYTGLFRPIQAF
ncbi:uncharacterized protein [Onthophagus taurus]|uniref:uncharacterized protein isoform X2 n=1 Tax=Onthophagus taurus TaxID=166361 RepID=UPI0039BE0F56